MEAVEGRQCGIVVADAQSAGRVGMLSQVRLAVRGRMRGGVQGDGAGAGHTRHGTFGKLVSKIFELLLHI
jgi:hypothetical protein